MVLICTPPPPHFSLPCISKVSLIYYFFSPWSFSLLFRCCKKEHSVRIICLFDHIPTAFPVLIIHILHCLKTVPFFFLKLQVFKYLDCGFLIQLFVFPGVSGYLLGTNAFITNSFVFPECIAIQFGLNKWSYHFLPGTSFPERHALIWTWLFPGAATQLSPCTVVLPHSPGSHPQHPTSYSSVYQRISPRVPSQGLGRSKLSLGLPV